MDRRKRRRLLSALQSGILEYIRSISNTAIASFTGDGRDLVRLVVGIEPVQAGSGDPSPDNVRPISGWTQAKVTRTGKNLLDPSARTNSSQNIRYYPYDNLLLKAGTYTLSISSQVSGLYVNSGASTLFTKYNSTFLTFTLTEDMPVNFNFYKMGIDTSLLCQLEVSSTASSYEPYQGQTYTIDLDGTRYGGTLDVTSGKLTVTDGYIASYDGETLPSTWISDRDVYAAGTNPTNGAEVVYKLVTPIEVQLTPTQITTLSGVTNNIWADTGDIILLEYMA